MIQEGVREETHEKIEEDVRISLGILDLRGHMEGFGKPVSYPKWYVGLTNDPEERKSQHIREGKLKGNLSTWMAVDAESVEVARKVEKYFTVKNYFHSDGYPNEGLSHPCQGGPGGGDDDSRFVYAFKMNS